MLLQRNINAFSISLTDRGLRMDGDGVGNRTKPSSVSVNDFIKNYGITEFYCLSADPLMDFSLIP